MKVDATSFEQSHTAGVPPHLRDGLLRYVNDHERVGRFLTAVLENNLADAMARGDEESRAGLYAIVCWVYNEAPSACWGSLDNVKAWLERVPDPA
jgi:glutathione S-transferase